MHYRVFQLEVISIAMFGNLTPNCFGCWEFCPNSIHRWWQLSNSDIHHLTENLYFVRLLKTFGRSRSGGGGFLVGYFLVFLWYWELYKKFCLSVYLLHKITWFWHYKLQTFLKTISVSVSVYICTIQCCKLATEC